MELIVCAELLKFLMHTCLLLIFKVVRIHECCWPRQGLFPSDTYTAIIKRAIAVKPITICDVTVMRRVSSEACAGSGILFLTSLAAKIDRKDQLQQPICSTKNVF